MNERILQSRPYPTVALDERKTAVRAKGIRLFDFGTGDPNEPTPEFIRQALIDNVPTSSCYTSVHGSPELRQAAAGYLGRRFGLDCDPERELIACAGAMEAVFHLPMILVHEGSPRQRVVYGEPAYRVFELGALYASAEPTPITLTDEHRYLLRPSDLGPERLAETAIVYLNYPHNPSGQTMPAELYREWVEARQEHGFVLVSDECYVDVYFHEADRPRSLLEFGQEGCLSIFSLSKRSGMTGYFTGFLAGDPELIARLRHHRAGMGLQSPVWTQAAATAAWTDQAHVDERRSAFGAKRRVLLELLASRGLEVYPGTASLFLWVRVPEGHSDLSYAESLLDHGIVVSPGSFYGPGQDRYFRMALVPTLDEIHQLPWPR